MRWLLRWMVFLIGALIGQSFMAGEPGGAPAPDGAPALPAAPPPPTPPAAPTPAEARFTKADLDAARADEKQKLDRQAAAAKQKTDEAALLEQNKFKELADQRGVEVETLRSQAETATRYGERLNTWVESEIKDWPKEVKALDPGKEQLEARLDWVEKSRPLAQRLASLPTPPATEAGRRDSGTPPTTPPAGGDGATPPARYRFQSSSDVAW